jgi:hypothetical protein
MVDQEEPGHVVNILLLFPWLGVIDGMHKCQVYAEGYGDYCT